MNFDLIFLPSTLHGQPERYAQMFELIQAADELGYNCAWFTEHHFDEYGRPAPLLQALHAANLTKRIKIGTAVVVLPLHHPIHVAEEVATLDHLTGGRFQFGIGVAHPPTHARMGVTPGKPIADIRAFVARLKSFEGIGALQGIHERIKFDKTRL